MLTAVAITMGTWLILEWLYTVIRVVWGLNWLMDGLTNYVAYRNGCIVVRTLLWLMGNYLIVWWLFRGVQMTPLFYEIYFIFYGIREAWMRMIFEVQIFLQGNDCSKILFGFRSSLCLGKCEFDVFFWKLLFLKDSFKWSDSMSIFFAGTIL